MERLVEEPRNKTYLPIILGVVVIGIVGLMQFTATYDIEFYYSLADSLYILVPTLMAGTSLFLLSKLIKNKHKDTRSFIFLATALAANFIGEQIWTFYKNVLEIEPYPSLGDVFFLLFYPAMIVFLLKYLKFEFRKVSKINLFFAILIPAAFLYPTMMFTYEYNIEETDLGMLIAVTYTVSDAVILGFALLSALRQFKEHNNNFWLYLNLGIFVWIIANTAFLYADLNEEYYDGHIVDALWLVSYVLWTFAIFNFYQNIKRDRKFSLVTNKALRSNYKAINHLGIPLIVATVFAVSILLMGSLGFFDFSNYNELTYSAVVFIFALIAVFSGIIVAVNKNLSRLVTLREMELEEKNKHMLRLERYSAIGEISARIAHDIRNPLSVIKNTTELFFAQHQEHITEEDKENLSRIRRSTYRITHQIDDVLDFVKEQSPEFSKESLDEMLNAAKSDIPNYPNIDIRIESSGLSVPCDKNLMHRVFVNLLVNSVQAMEEKGTIVIRSNRDRQFTSIEFEDSGPGVPSELINTVFEPLYTTKQQGTGLGLSICKRIIEQHSGRISVTNNPTKFVIELPN